MSARREQIGVGRRRSIAVQVVVLATALVIGLAAGVELDRIVFRTSTEDLQRGVQVVLPSEGLATRGVAVHERVDEVMNTILADARRAEWATTSASIRQRVNDAMNAVLARRFRGEWATASATLHRQVDRAMNRILASDAG